MLGGTIPLQNFSTMRNFLDEAVMAAHVYVLELENGCWYVGCSSSLTHRLKQHKAGLGAAWTKINPMLRVALIFPNKPGLERIITSEMQTLFGLEKVRGAGSTNPPGKKRLTKFQGVPLQYLAMHPSGSRPCRAAALRAVPSGASPTGA